MTSRRGFLKGSALAIFGAGAAPAWLARSVYATELTPGNQRKKVLVAVFQRGAVDGLNVIVPYGDKRYYELRPSLGIPANAVLDLNGYFGLHPALAPLKPIWDAHNLAIVDAVGSPDPTRSHFDAQDYMESGTPGLKATQEGWMNRVLRPEQGKVSPVRAVSVGTNLARTLRGHNSAIALNNLNDFQVQNAVASSAFESMYDQALDTTLHGTGRETFDAVKMLQAVQKQAYVPAAAAEYPKSRFGKSLQQIAQLIKSDVGLEVAFTDIGGWDTHVNQVGAQPAEGQMANTLKDFAGSLAAFYHDLGDHMADVSVVTMSEFGRTAHENGNRGTDHGHANYMLAFGGGVRGGKVYGDWPGLGHDQLYEGRDLALTTDFRDVLGEMVVKHLGNPNTQTVFPGYAPKFRGILG